MDNNRELKLVCTDGEIDLLEEKGFEDTDFFFYIGLHNTYEIVGNINYRPYDDLEYYGNVEYTIYEKYRGNKYALKALKLLKKVLEDYKVSDDLYFNIFTDNYASLKVAKEFGGTFIKYNEIPKKHVLYNQSSTNKIAIFKYELEKNKNK